MGGQKTKKYFTFLKFTSNALIKQDTFVPLPSRVTDANENAIY